MMHRFFRSGGFYALAPDESAGGGFDATMDAIAEGYSSGDAGGAPAAPEAPVPAPAVADPLAALTPEAAPDDMPYRDAAKLRQEIARAREQYGPYAQAFGGLDDPDREAMLELARLLQNGDNETVARYLAESAQQIGGDEWTWPNGDPAPEGAAGAEPPDEPRFLTEADLDARLAEREQARAVADAQAEILAEARDLGYDPESTNPIDRARWAGLIAIAEMSPDGSIQSAHEALSSWEQQIRDDYVQGKAADAGRPVPTDGGATPVESARLDTLDDAESAMRARMDQAFGPR